MVSRRSDKKPEKKSARLRNKELEQIQTSGVWRAKQTADGRQPSANIQMAFLLPSEFRALADQEVYSDLNESK